MKATLRLFKSLPIKNKEKGEVDTDLFVRTIRRGFIFSPEVISNYSRKELLQMISTFDEIGLTPEQMNSSFHKSWQKVRDASIEQLVLEQIIHYMTTYGFERLGVYSQDSVYIPREELDIPEIDIDTFKVVVIKGYTKEEFKEKLLGLLMSGIALHEDTIKDVVDIALWLELTEKEISRIRNKEVNSILYDYLDLIPQDPIEFLRYLVYKSTEKTLLIKNKELIDGIKSNKNVGVIKLFKKYDAEYGFERLAEIFYRFKPLFLAFKTNPQLNKIINKLRKLAIKCHKPMKPDFLNDVTSILKKDRCIDEDLLIGELDRVNIFRKIRLAYALKFRTGNCNSILYRIRNGKGYATDFYFHEHEKAEQVLNTVMESIIQDVKKNVEGKKIYIPSYMKYTLPATEKQFTGNFPSGSCISLDKDMVFGIHWQNVDHHRIDLDLSVMSQEGKIGWDSDYRNESRTILFSGDMTDAAGKKGATELFYVKRRLESTFIMFVNYYNFDDSVEVPFKIMVAKELIEKFKENYMVDPNNVVAVASSVINQKQKVLGFGTITPEQCKFYFAETYLGRSITSSGSEFVEHSRKYLFDFYTTAISLNYVLERAGMVEGEKGNCDIDLSPEILEKDSVLKLLVTKYRGVLWKSKDHPGTTRLIA